MTYAQLRGTTSRLESCPKGDRIGTVLIIALVALSIYPTSGGGAAPVDIVLAICGVHLVVSWAAGDHAASLAGPAVRRMLVAMSMFAVVTLAYSLPVNASATRSFMKTFSLAYFAIPVAVLVRNGSLLRSLHWVWLAVGGTLLVTVYGDDSERPAGLMSNPNLTGSWFACMFVLAIMPNRTSRAVQLVNATIAFLGLIQTQSYAAMLGVLVAIVYMGVRARRTIWKLGVVLGAILIAVSWKGSLGTLQAGDRSSRSAETRFGIWSAGFALGPAPDGSRIWRVH